MWKKYFSRKFLAAITVVASMFFGEGPMTIVREVVAGVAAVTYMVVEGLNDAKRVEKEKE